MLEPSASVNRLSLSLRTSALLRQAGVRTLADLQQLPAAAMRGEHWTPAVRAEVWAWLAPTATLEFELDAAREEIARLRALIDAPELQDFAAGVVREAAHQVDRWGANHDAGKSATDWFSLFAWLSGKALRADLVGDLDKARHHCVTAAAAMAHWHGQLSLRQAQEAQA